MRATNTFAPTFVRLRELRAAFQNPLMCCVSQKSDVSSVAHVNRATAIQGKIYADPVYESMTPTCLCFSSYVCHSARYREHSPFASIDNAFALQTMFPPLPHIRPTLLLLLPFFFYQGNVSSTVYIFKRALLWRNFNSRFIYWDI